MSSPSGKVSIGAVVAETKAYEDDTHKQVRGSYGGTALCSGRIPFGMVWEWARVTCQACLKKRRKSCRSK
jgi:hypothetical protein